MTMDVVISKAVSRAGELRLVKVPDVVYQIMYDIAQSDQGGDTEQARLLRRKAAIFKALRHWVEEKYPEYGIVNFVDYNRKEAEEVNGQLYQKGSKFRVEWGMYVLIGRGVAASLDTDITNLITNPIEDGRQLNGPGGSEAPKGLPG